jgi:predicted HAD superfamily phosphohydrolase YqeG
MTQLVGLSSFDRLLYVGDHMYSDVLRAKRTLGWRTMLVVPELEKVCIYIYIYVWGRWLAV